MAIASGGDEDRRDGDRDGAGVPSPRSLNSVVLAAIPVVVVDAGARNGEDCAACLTELEPGEKAHALSRCGYRFHVECGVGEEDAKVGEHAVAGQGGAMVARQGGRSVLG